MKILLASKSPRRIEILSQLIGDKFVSKGSECEESFVGKTPEDTVLEIAYRKLTGVQNPEKYDVIISCDTLVYRDGNYYGKPTSREDAANMLRELANKNHQVYSGLVVKKGNKIIQEAVCSDVVFKNLKDSDIEYYLDNYEYMDKAGSYGIQDNMLVSGYSEEGFYNIMGMPKDELKDILVRFGIVDEK
ncbi:MAG TPA: nucleoside triphosphate pyrophosphatase [Clostridia bacterium]|jgi:septum formation protein|nr:nucleoside triphosphate pyrophosphatase [Clostridia bacterium]